MITNEEAVKMSQELYDYCNHRHEINPKGYFEKWGNVCLSRLPISLSWF